MNGESNARETAKLAANYFENGDNCTQAVIKAVRDVTGADLPADAERFGAGFTGGIAHSGAVCGALVGGVMVLGWASGDGSTCGNDHAAAKLAGRLKNEFDRACSGPNCETVREGLRFRHRRARELCRRATALAAGMTVDLLESGDIADDCTEYLA